MHNRRASFTLDEIHLNVKGARVQDNAKLSSFDCSSKHACFLSHPVPLDGRRPDGGAKRLSCNSGLNRVPVTQNNEASRSLARSAAVDQWYPQTLIPILFPPPSIPRTDQ